MSARWVQTILVCGALVASTLLACGPPRRADAPPAAAPTQTRVAAAPTQTGVAAAPPALAGGAPSPSPVAGASPGRAQATGDSISVALNPVSAKLNRPVHLTHAGDGSGRLFVVEKRGRIMILQDGVAREKPFLDIGQIVNAKGSEQGLLSVAFHPQFTTNGRFFIGHTDLDGSQVVAGYRVSADPDVADPASRKVVLSMPDPAPNHNGGLVLFGPDGYLWIGTGDGGGAGDQFRNSQNRQALLGKMLRIDVDRGDPYAIPADNPFVNAPDTRPEVWAIGLRNPWRYSFDRATGDLYIGDVGQNAYEEVNVRRAGTAGGENYGWPMMEGQHCFPIGQACDETGLVRPVAEYGRSAGLSITGGHVYRGQAIPQLVGRYVFGDFGTGRIWALDEPQPGTWRMVELLRSGRQISSFGEDEAGELYLVDYDDQRIYRFAPRTS